MSGKISRSEKIIFSKDEFRQRRVEEKTKNEKVCSERKRGRNCSPKPQSKSAAALETFFPPQPQHTIVDFPSLTKPQLHTNSQPLTPVSSAQPEKKEGKEQKEEKRKKKKRPGSLRPCCNLAWHFPSPAGSPPRIIDRPIWASKNFHDAVLASADCSRASVEIAVWYRRQNKSHERTKKGRKERTFLFAPPVWEKHCWERVDCVPQKARTSTLTDHVT